MKTLFIVILVSVIVMDVNGQTWSGTTPGNIHYSSGNVGIGGTADANARLKVNGEIVVSRDWPYIQLTSSYWGDGFYIQNGVTETGLQNGNYTVFYNPGSKGFTFRQGSYSALTIQTNGNVGIGGSADPTNKLKVHGEIDVTRDYPYIQLNSSVWSDGFYIQNAVTEAGALNGNYTVFHNPGSKGFSFCQGNNSALTIQGNGNVGIGVTNSNFKFAVAGEIHINRDYPYIQLNSSYWNGGSFVQNGVQLDGQGGGDYFLFYNPSAKGFNFRQGTVDAFTIRPNGNVLIAKTSQVNSIYKLDVNGSIRSNEVVVNTTGADFVFQDTYDLRTLEEVEKFIQANKHLPDIESASEMEKNGLELGEINMKLLQKVEELTLYIIEQEKKMKALEKRLDKSGL